MLQNPSNIKVWKIKKNCWLRTEISKNTGRSGKKKKTKDTVDGKGKIVKNIYLGG